MRRPAFRSTSTATRSAYLTLAQIDPEEALRRVDAMDDPKSLDEKGYPERYALRNRIVESLKLRDYLRSQ